MKKKYNSAKLEIIFLDRKEIVTVNGPGNGGHTDGRDAELL